MSYFFAFLVHPVLVSRNVRIVQAKIQTLLQQVITLSNIPLVAIVTIEIFTIKYDVM